MCVAYEVDGKVMKQMPASTRRMEAIKPIYERLPGWKASTRGIAHVTDLPPKAKQYLEFLEEKTEVEIGSVSNGPERKETIIFPGTKLERLLG